MRISSRLFRDAVWPEIKSALGGGSLITLEGVYDSKIAYNFDTLACIDSLQIHPEKGIRGIASRIQTDNKDWSSFTIRDSRITGARTEREKLNFLINGNGGWFYPHLHVQAYAKSQNGPIISIGIVRTVDLVRFVNETCCESNCVHNATFSICWWQDMINNGIQVHVIKPVCGETIA